MTASKKPKPRKAESTLSDATGSAKTSSSLLLTKGLRLLRHVAEQGECGVREVARDMGISPTVAHRLVTSLLTEGFLEQSDDTRRYRIGAQAFEVGRAFLKAARIENVAPPIMRKVVEEGEFNAFLSVMRGSHVVYLSAMQDNGRLNVRMQPGSEAPAHSTSMGKVILAELSDEEILQRVHFYQSTKPGADAAIDTKRLLQEINVARHSGYAVSDDEAFRGVVSVGVPIRDFSRRVVAALSLSMPKSAKTKESFSRLLKKALETGHLISYGLGDRES